MHILLIEDDAHAARYLKRGLAECGHVVDTAEDGNQGLQLALTGRYDVLVVDRMLPERDGLSVIRMLRADQNLTPALVLSALGEVDDRVEGLRAGGDDYLVKPYAFSELLARVEALERRQSVTAHRSADSEFVLRYADIAMNIRTREVTRAGKQLRLQPREFSLLEYLVRNAGHVVTRTMLLEQVWEFHFDPQTNVIDVQISRLRSKLDRDFETPLLHTVRGIGYKLSEEAPK